MENFNMKYPIVTKHLTPKTKRRPGLPMQDVVFIVAHDTGNPGSTARGNVNYYERSNNEMSASAHLFVDDKEIIECIPVLTATPEKAWHVHYNVDGDNKLYGVNANDAAIGVEYCFGGNIDADEAYKRYIWTIAYACHKFGLVAPQCIVGHFFLDPKRKTDPVTGLAQSRRTYEQLLRDIEREFKECSGLDSIDDFSGEKKTGVVRAAVKLNIREGAPSTKAKVAQVVPAGTPLKYDAVVRNGESVNGNSVWYKVPEQEQFFWSGGAH
jgi:hypothetical protein